MKTLRVDPTIAEVIPDPAPVEESDRPEIGKEAAAFAGALDRKRLWLDQLRSSLESSKRFDPKVPVLVWRGKNVIVDGIQRYHICRELGIRPVVEEMDFEDAAAAIRERVRRNIGSNRATYLSDFARAEMVFDLWEKYFEADWKASLNRGGRGKKAAVRRDALAARAELCGLKRAQMGRAERIIRYASKPASERNVPKEVLDEMLRRLRNGTRDISTVDGSIKGMEERTERKRANRQVVVAALNAEVQTQWTGETNVVINGDCLKILQQIPRGAIDRFVLSPPYYIADGSNPQNVIRYGEEYVPFRSWDHYCNWTVRYLAAMWRILPTGGYIVINVDNTREPTKRAARGKDGRVLMREGKVVLEPNPLAGRFWYHTDLIRAIMQDIDAYSAAIRLPEIAEDDEFNPLRSRLFDAHPLAAQGDELYQRVVENEMFHGGFYGTDARAVDCGEFIWAKSQVVAKREATGSVSSPQRRPNNEYVLFWRKGEPVPQASTMGPEDLSKGTISSWEDVGSPSDGAEERWGDYWIIPASPDQNRNHAAKFPAKLAYRMITFGGSLGDVICDPFSGTGTSLYVAARTGRRYVGIELVKNNANLARKEGMRGQDEYRQRNAE